MKNYSLFVFLLLAGSVTAQNKAFKTRADQAFDLQDYTTAAFYYDKSIETEARTRQGKVPYFSVRQGTDVSEIAGIRFKLAESHRLTQNYALAADLYKMILETDEASYPLSRLWYGVCLRSTNQPDGAISQLQLFISSNKGKTTYEILANNELKNARFAKAQLEKKTSATVTKLQEGLDSVHVDRHTMDAQGRSMYQTRSDKKDGETTSAIYLSRFLDGRWTAAFKLSSFVNAESYSAMHPYVTPDGKRLFYVSNRVGGLGGYDIWMSDLDPDGLPVNAINLGEAINTAADEASPYYHAPSQKLVFSSKGYVGMGNFDLYESTTKVDGSWTYPQNLGSPYNSTTDDLHYYIDDQGEGSAYLSSDRESPCCLKLFKVNLAKQETVKSLFTVYTGRVTDCGTGRALSDVKVELIDAQSQASLSEQSDKTGTYEFKLTPKHIYQLLFQKEGYFSKMISLPALSGTAKLDGTEICLKMFEVNKPIVIENVLHGFNKASLIQESLTVLEDIVVLMKDNPKIKFELSSHTDSIGPDWYNNRLSQQRAQACVDYIVSRGVSDLRIFAKGYGESRPVQPNSLPNGKDNKEGRRMNRRTEFKVLSVE
jgi:OOP family OmpA-OmpF porin